MINLKLWSLGWLLLFSVGQLSAERNYRYRVNLKDKEGTAYSVENPQAFLSERALERRSRQGLSIDETDLPISQIYIEE